MKKQKSTQDNLDRPIFETVIGVLFLSSMIFLAFSLSGCATFRDGDGTVERSQTHRHQWQDKRLEKEATLFSKPTIDFRLTASAAQALSSVEPTFDSEGNEIPAIQLTYHDPRHEFSDYVEHPLWAWLPSGRDLLWGGISVWQIERGYSMQKRQLTSQERREMRFYDTQDRVIDNAFELQSQGDD